MAILNRADMPLKFPTHKHAAEFWEALGRAVATFGFLEEILGKGIFAFTGMQTCAPGDVEAALQDWQKKLELALSDPLYNLSESFGKAVRDYDVKLSASANTLVEKIKDISKVRNALCHGSWGVPNPDNASSLPFFVTRKMEMWTTPVDVIYLNAVQSEAASLAFDVIDFVTGMGWKFPGSNSPGKSIW